MNIIKVKLEHRWYIPLYNWLNKHRWGHPQIEETEQGFRMVMPHSNVFTVAGHTIDDEKQLIHLWGTWYVLLCYYYDYSKDRW